LAQTYGPFGPFHPALLAYTIQSLGSVSLDDCVRAIQGEGRKARALVGPDSVMERTLGLGQGFGELPVHELNTRFPFDPHNFKKTYVDNDRKESSVLS